jgi:hypothetical protein
MYNNYYMNRVSGYTISCHVCNDNNTLTDNIRKRTVTIIKYISGFLTNSSLATTKYGMNQAAFTDWNFVMFTYHGGKTTLDYCAAWCRINRESTTYPNCNVFVHDSVNSRCYMGDIDMTGAPIHYLSGIRDVYYEIGIILEKTKD